MLLSASSILPLPNLFSFFCDVDKVTTVNLVLSPRKMVVGPVARVKLSVEAEGLASMDWTSKSDPICFLYEVDPATRAETLIGQVCVLFWPQTRECKCAQATRTHAQAISVPHACMHSLLL